MHTIHFKPYASPPVPLTTLQFGAASVRSSGRGMGRGVASASQGRAVVPGPDIGSGPLWSASELEKAAGAYNGSVPTYALLTLNPNLYSNPGSRIIKNMPTT